VLERSPLVLGKNGLEGAIDVENWDLKRFLATPVKWGVVDTGVLAERTASEVNVFPDLGEAIKA